MAASASILRPLATYRGPAANWILPFRLQMMVLPTILGITSSTPMGRIDNSALSGSLSNINRHTLYAFKVDGSMISVASFRLVHDIVLWLQL